MLEKIRTIRLYGKLGAQFGRVHRLSVRSAAEAVRALCVVVPGFEKVLLSSAEQGVGYAVFSGKENLSAEQLRDPAGSQDIRIAPIISGSKQAGIFQVIVGVVIFVAGLFSGGTAWAAYGPMMMVGGAALAIGGVISMLSPQAKVTSAQDAVDNRGSYNFNWPVNTEAQGNPVPLLYGRLICGSAVISAGIWAEDQS